jgi:protein translocase SecG subunit
MSLLIGFLTFMLVLSCLFLMLLVLVQLPKKEAGAGLAFGAGAVDTLIGAGSGNALTTITKYASAVFLGLSVLLAVLNAQRHQSSSRSLQEELARKSSAAPMLPTTAAPAVAPTTGTLSNQPTPKTAPAAGAATPAAAPTSGQLQPLTPGQQPAVNLSIPAPNKAATPAPTQPAQQGKAPATAPAQAPAK